MRLALATFLVCALSIAAAKAPVIGKKEGPLDRGATRESEAAVEKGLRWLALHQATDGHWGLDDFNRHARTEPLPKGKVVRDASTTDGGRKSDAAGTAMALLPFLAAGHTHKKAGPYQTVVKLGLQFLVKRQENGGMMAGAFDRDMYAHCLALMALSEAYGLTKDITLRRSAQAGVDFLVKAQHDGGGWRYTPRTPGDTSVSGFAIRAVAGARRAGLSVPKKALTQAELFIDSVTTGDRLASYMPRGGPTAAMTAVATYCRLLLGGNPRGPNVQAGVRFIRKNQPRALDVNLYFAYYATQALYELGGKDWDDWNAGKAGFRDLLVKNQDDGMKVKGNAGSWRGHAFLGGRIGATSFALLSLLVYHRDRGMKAPTKVEP